jgi:hypothetical protein
MVEWLGVMIALNEIHGFQSPEHFVQFKQAINEAVARNELTPVPVERPYASEMFEETWYLTASGQVWRLVSPDFPFKGVFEQVQTGN